MKYKPYHSMSDYRHILVISDIHFEKNEPENQGKVLSRFFEDIKNQLRDYEERDLFCIISGDLVNKAGIPNIYDSFYDNVLKPLTEIIPANQILVTPGNHDLNRGYVEDKFERLIEVLDKNESEFNEYCKEKDNLISPKFKQFDTFIEKSLPHLPNTTSGYYVNIRPEISVLLLNSALCAFGGANDFEDDKKLKVDTSLLNEWIEKSRGRCRILVMHHPIESLEPSCKAEIEALTKSDIDLLLDGHIHTHTAESGFEFNIHKFIHLGTPQLFSDKHDDNGYSILHFKENELYKIEYRQWMPDHNKFLKGIKFTGNDEGWYEKPLIQNEIRDTVGEQLRQLWIEALNIYNHQPKWVERYLTTTPPSNRSEKDKSNKIDYISIIDSTEDYQIIGGKQFGLTSYARYLAFKAWEEKKRFVYLDLQKDGLTLSNIERKVNDAFKFIFSDGYPLDGILIDNWDSNIAKRGEIINKLREKFPESRIVLFANELDSQIIKGLETPENKDGFKTLYMRELGINGIKELLTTENGENIISAEKSIALARVNQELTAFNFHRTPLNCLQIILSLSTDFEERTINRAKVMSRLLQYIFDNPGNYSYRGSKSFSDNDCRYLLGAFAEYLFRRSDSNDRNLMFTEREFINVCEDFTQKNRKNYNVSWLFRVLCNHKIISEQYDGQFRFRFINWIYYFAAARMVRNKVFSDYMINDVHGLYLPELIEYYTGLDDGRSDMVTILTEEMKKLNDDVSSLVKVNGLTTIFDNLKWNLNEAEKGKTIEQLEKSVKESSMPDEIKASYADSQYDPQKPYFQMINEYIEEYGIRRLFELTYSASRALRNCEHLDEVSKKDRLLEEILRALDLIANIVLLLSGLLAKNGYCGLGGQGFKLEGDFATEFEDCLKQVVTNVPYNIARWFKDDLYADNLAEHLYEYMMHNDYPHSTNVTRHILALILTMECAPDMKNKIQKYIGSVGKRSFYLGDLNSCLRHTYSYNFLTSSDESALVYLIKSAHSKHTKGGNTPGVTAINRVENSILPPKCSESE